MSVKTISDIAKIAGVSKSTVSRALNESPLISDATRLRIQSIAREHNFSIDHSARTLSLQKTQTIGLVVPISAEAGIFITDPFAMELIASVAQAAREAGYDLLLTQAELYEQEWIDRLVHGKRVDGVIMLGCGVDRIALEHLGQAQANFIVWGEPPLEQAYCSVVSHDVQGGKLATEHLVEIGRKKIAFIGGDRNGTETQRRYQGYLNALRRADLAVNEQCVVYGNFSSRSGYAAMQQLLASDGGIDAVFVCSDVMAIGAMEALREAGRRIPEDVAVVGFDGIPLAAHCSPPLTTIEQNIGQAGKLLVDNLLRYMQDRIIVNALLPVELVVRQSALA